MSKLKIYDENDNFIGEYIGEFVEDTKDNISDSFDESVGSGCLTILCVLAFKFPWLILVIIGWFLLKLIWIIIKFVGRVLWWIMRFCIICLWWLIRLPITLILDKDVPVWWLPKW